MGKKPPLRLELQLRQAAFVCLFAGRSQDPTQSHRVCPVCGGKRECEHGAKGRVAGRQAGRHTQFHRVRIERRVCTHHKRDAVQRSVAPEKRKCSTASSMCDTVQYRSFERAHPASQPPGSSKQSVCQSPARCSALFLHGTLSWDPTDRIARLDPHHYLPLSPRKQDRGRVSRSLRLSRLSGRFLLSPVSRCANTRYFSKLACGSSCQIATKNVLA